MVDVEQGEACLRPARAPNHMPCTRVHSWFIEAIWVPPPAPDVPLAEVPDPALVLAVVLVSVPEPVAPLVELPAVMLSVEPLVPLPVPVVPVVLAVVSVVLADPPDPVAPPVLLDAMLWQSDFTCDFCWSVSDAQFVRIWS